jgi:hypothetical protein
MSSRRVPKDWLIDQTCMLVFPNGQGTAQTKIQVSFPTVVAPTTECDNFESSCWVQLDDIVNLGGPVLGASTLHVLCVSLRLLVKTLDDFCKVGGRVEDVHGKLLNVRDAELIATENRATSILARHYVLSVSSSGMHKDGIIALGSLTRIADDGWRVDLVSDGTADLDVAVVSDSPLACLLVGIDSLCDRVARRVAEGWELLEPYDRSAIDIETLFSLHRDGDQQSS